MVGGTNKMTDNLKTDSEYETEKGEESVIEGSGNERERNDRRNDGPENKRETPPEVCSRSALGGSSRHINVSSSSAASGEDSKEEDGEAWQHVPLGRNLRSKMKRGCKTQTGNEKLVKSGHRSSDRCMDGATVKAESEKMDLARKRGEKRRALLLNENEDDDDDNDEDSLEDDRNLEVSLEKELANIRAGLRTLVVGSKGLTKGGTSRIFARIERYENEIVRMSVENERLEGTFNKKLAAMDERMNSIEDMMKQVLDKMVKEITEGMVKSIEAKVDVMCEKVAGRMNVELSEMKGMQPGSAKSTAVPGKSYALIVKGANEKLTSMEVQKRMFESLSDETGVKIDREWRSGGRGGDGGGSEATGPKRFEPRVIVYDFPSSVTDASLLQELAHKKLDGLARTEDVKEKIKIVRRAKRGNDARVGNMIVELPNEWKEQLLKNGRLYVGWMLLC
ncbi:hypothetical protein TSAR_006848 [Trichomalopsis sarcophagae]|uniref:Uncharacterized protein n=1 Tax=Trichomalopsis sarcophagae TaxID=543379 RepID=A0A232F286_9HYME|nr:hypothetical protein TSAR_006848 [Trichomalopsis sarcophagae]